MHDTTAAHTDRTSHLDHTELLLLDGAVTRLTESFVTTRTLSSAQREILEEYGEDVSQLLPTLSGPARDFAEQLAGLVDTVLASTARTVCEKPGKSYAAA